MSAWPLGAQVSPAAFDEHDGDMVREHQFVNALSSSCAWLAV
jgi:hypothetical protein